jgi:hypothetical protein
MLENIYKLLYKIKDNNIVNKFKNNNPTSASKHKKSESKHKKSESKHKKSASKHKTENTKSDEDFIDKPTLSEQQKILEKLIIRQTRRKIEQS